MLERMPHLVANSLEIQNSQSWYSPGKPFAIPFFLANRVTEERKVFQVFEFFERFKIPKLRDVVVCQNKSGEMGY